jgi:hypothetical protein
MRGRSLAVREAERREDDVACLRGEPSVAGRFEDAFLVGRRD